MKKLTQFILGAVIVAPLAMTMACGNNNNGSGSGGSASQCGGVGSTGFQSVVDVAVADDTSDDNGNNPVFLYFDVLANADTGSGGVFPAASAILDNDASAVGNALSDTRAVFLTSDASTNGGDLYVASNGNSELLIWRDYTTLTGGEDADVMLDNSGGSFPFSNMIQLVVDADDNLVIADEGNDAVQIYIDASALAGNGVTDADIELDGNCTNFNTCIDGLTNVFVSSDDGTTTGGDLFVASDSTVATGDPYVAIYRDINSLTTGDDPDAGLTDDVSFFDLGCGADVVHVANNILFVGTDCAEVYVFEGADGLATDALPDAILFGAGSYIDEPRSLATVDVGSSGLTVPTLLVGSYNDYLNYNANQPAISGFFDYENLTTGQSADAAVLYETSNVSRVTSMVQTGGALVVSGTRAGEGYYPYDVVIFRNVQGSGVCSSMVPNIVIPGSGLDDAQDEFGSFGSVADYYGMHAVTRTTTN